MRLLIGVAICAIAFSRAFAAPPLVLEATIALPDTSGRIDHLAIDLTRQRLFVAEPANDSVDVVDLTGGRVIHRVAGLKQPQGVLYVPKSDLLAVANGGDGSLRLFSAGDFGARGVIVVGRDADNLRIDPRNGNVIVGHGNGGLAIVDAARVVMLRDIELPEHPEGFQLASDGKAYVNVPNAHQIAVADMASGRLIGKWTMPGLSANFPMAFGDGDTVAVVFRAPERMVRFDRSNGRVMSETRTGGDADDIFFDAARHRYYASCGSGTIEVFQVAAGTVTALASIPTAPGARTSLFVAELDRLFLAVRAGPAGSSAAIQIFRPMEDR